MAIEKFGSDAQQVNTITGGLTSADGAPLLDTNSEGGRSTMFGPAAIREIQNGVANGDFGLPPTDPSEVFDSTSNNLPYWDFTDESGGNITLSLAPDSSTGYTTSSGYVLRAIYKNAAATPDYARLERWVPILGGSNRPSSYNPEFTALFATNTNTVEVQIYCQFYKEDKLTAVGTAWSQTFTGAQLYAAGATGTAGSVATKSSLNYFSPSTTSSTAANWLRSVAPADAAYLRILMDFQVPGAGPTADVRIDIAEVRLPFTQTDIILSDKTAPATYGPGHIWQENGVMYVAGQQGKRTGVTVPDTFPGWGGSPSVSSGTVGIVGPVYLWGIGNNTYPINSYIAVGDPNLYTGTSSFYSLVIASSTGTILIGFDPALDTSPDIDVFAEQLIMYAGAFFVLTSPGNLYLEGLEMVINARNTADSKFYEARRGTTQSIANNTYTDITFTADSDPGGWWDAVGSSISIATSSIGATAGYYSIHFNVGFASNGTGYRAARIELNGVTVAETRVDPVDGSATLMSVSAIVLLDSASDFVNCSVYQNSGGSLDTTVTALAQLARVAF
jgi:hypothetical protein